jgi:molybdate transport system substrate-binding protein
MSSRTRLSTLVIAAVVMVGCSASAGSPSADSVSSPAGSSSAGAELTVFGAASLARALEAAKVAYATANSGAVLTISTDSSAALATQITEGAPADVFLSADTTNPQQLVDAGLADGDAVPFAGNELTIITPTDNPGALTTPFDLGKQGVRVIAAGDEVPVTRYATQLVENLAASAGAPEDFAAAYAANIASKEDNVAAVRTKIELGEGDGAIVYVTDAAASDEVATIDVPDDVNVPATYAGVVVKASSNTAAAHAFLDWLAGPEGQGTLAEFGFLPPSP